jgi:hypothetical protein
VTGSLTYQIPENRRGGRFYRAQQSVIISVDGQDDQDGRQYGAFE